MTKKIVGIAILAWALLNTNSAFAILNCCCNSSTNAAGDTVLTNCEVAPASGTCPPTAAPTKKTKISTTDTTCPAQLVIPKPK